MQVIVRVQDRKSTHTVAGVLYTGKEKLEFDIKEKIRIAQKLKYIGTPLIKCA